MRSMKITLIGAGNLGTHLYKTFVQHPDIELHQWHNTRLRSDFTPENIAVIHNFSAISKESLCILAVADDAISSVSKQLHREAFVVHTSGAVNLNSISQLRRGVFYPIQSFSPNRSISFKGLPVGIEAINSIDQTFLKALAKMIKAKPIILNSEQRRALHLAAVLVNNFTNHLYAQAEQLCEAHQISFDILKPLIRETVEKMETHLPRNAQTGPALRGDKKTIATHLQSIENKELKAIYRTITKSIQKLHGN